VLYQSDKLIEYMNLLGDRCCFVSPLHCCHPNEQDARAWVACNSILLRQFKIGLVFGGVFCLAQCGERPGEPRLKSPRSNLPIVFGSDGRVPMGLLDPHEQLRIRPVIADEPS
jgi:hypothetical protein